MAPPRSARPSRRRPGAAWSSWALLALAACVGEADGPGGVVAARDSAGVEILAPSAEPAWTEEERWRAEEELRVGGLGEDDGPAFGLVADLAVDDEGRIYVLDQQARTVVALGPDGAPRPPLAGPGEGPGEVGRFASSVMVRGDTVFLVDWSLGRLTRFSPDGEVRGTERLPTGGGARSWWKATPRGLLLRSLTRTLDDQGRWGGRDVLLRYVGEGEADTVMVFDYEHTELGGRGAPRAPLIVGAPAWAVLDDGSVAWIRPGEPRVRIHGPDGALRRILAAPWWTPRPPTAGEVETLERKLGDRLEALGGSRATLEALPVDAPELLPAVTSVAAGPGGTLWVQRMGPVERVHPMALNNPDPPGRLGGATWDVFEAGGAYLGAVELPRGFQLMRLGEASLHGVARDELDVERVVRLALRRGAPEG